MRISNLAEFVHRRFERRIVCDALHMFLVKAKKKIGGYVRAFGHPRFERRIVCDVLHMF